MPSFIDEYLVKLGAVVDSSGVGKFQAALHEMQTTAEFSVEGIAKKMLVVEAEMVAGFATIGLAAVGLVDKVAMADQEFRLFALHMYLGKEQARSLKIAMDALGQPLENLAWDPELRERARRLIEDQRAMAPEGDFNAQMEKIRDVRFEFTRMEVELEYLGMHVVQDFMQALGFGPDELLTKLRWINGWIIDHLPEISAKLVKYFLPVWHDIEHIMKDVWQVTLDFAQLFTNVIGMLSGDPGLQGAISFDKFAQAVEKVVHWIALAVDFLTQFIGLLTGAVAGGMIGTLIGMIVGGIAGIPGGPAGILAGAVAGGVTGGAALSAVGGLAGDVWDAYRTAHPATAALPGSTSGTVSSDAMTLAQRVSAQTGVPPDLIWSQWAHETGGFTHLGGAFNLAGINVPGGAGKDYRAFGSMTEFGDYYAGLLKSNYPQALTATNPEQFAQALKNGRRGAWYADDAGNYTRGMERYDKMYKSGATSTIGSINVTVGGSSSSADEIARKVADQTGKRVQRNLDEFQQQSWAYNW